MKHDDPTLTGFERKLLIFNRRVAIFAPIPWGVLAGYYLWHAEALYSSVAHLLYWTIVAGAIGYGAFILFLKYRSRFLVKLELLVFAPLAVLFVAIELILYLGEPVLGRSPDPFLDIHKSNMHIAIQVVPGALPGVEEHATFSTDAQGFRTVHQVNYARKDPGTKRIFIIGGSTIEQFYLDDRKNTAALLEGELNAAYRSRGITFEVINAGKSGRMTVDHFFVLREILKFHPDDVVILAGLNDLNNYVRVLYGEIDADSLSVARKRETIHYYLSRSQILRRAYYVKALILGILRGDEVQTVVSGGTEKRRAKWEAIPIVPVPEALKTPAPYFEENIDAIIRLAKANNVKVVLLTQPTIYQERMRAEEERVLSLIFGRNPGVRFPPREVDILMERYNGIIRRKAGEGIAVVDIASRLPKDLTVFYDDVHFNNGGALKVADALFEYFKGELK